MRVVGDRMKTCFQPFPQSSNYICECHRRMGNDFWFLPTAHCLLDEKKPWLHRLKLKLKKGGGTTSAPPASVGSHREETSEPREKTVHDQLREYMEEKKMWEDRVTRANDWVRNNVHKHIQVKFDDENGLQITYVDWPVIVKGILAAADQRRL